MKVFLAMPTMGSIPTQMAVFLYALLKYSKHEITICHTNRADISHARNILIEDFLKTDCDYLLFLDDDNPPEDVDIIDKLIEARKPVISALVPSRTPTRDGDHFLCVFTEGFKPTGEHEYKQCKSIPEGPEIMQIANCGMGCVLIEREVVKLVSDKYDRPCEMKMVLYYHDEGEWIRDELVDYPKLKDGTLRFKRYMSEDLLFFERAKDFGVTIWVHKGATCEHIGNPQMITVSTHIK